MWMLRMLGRFWGRMRVGSGRRNGGVGGGGIGRASHILVKPWLFGGLVEEIYLILSGGQSS